MPPTEWCGCQQLVEARRAPDDQADLVVPGATTESTGLPDIPQRHGCERAGISQTHTRVAKTQRRNMGGACSYRGLPGFPHPTGGRVEYRGGIPGLGGGS